MMAVVEWLYATSTAIGAGGLTPSFFCLKESRPNLGEVKGINLEQSDFGFMGKCKPKNVEAK